MKILAVAKRHPQQRDLIARPYGRFHHLPMQLATLGHKVQVLLCSHCSLPATELQRDEVRWISQDLRTLGPRRLLKQLQAEADAFSPDWIVGCSDAWYGWLAHRLARRTGARLAVDAYDNFEAYMPWNLPLHWQWRRAVRAADLVTAAGPQLASLLDTYRPGKPGTVIVPMAADPQFVPLDRDECRHRLGLPIDAPLLGYTGSWAGSRGTDDLLTAFRIIRQQHPDAQLVLTGKPPAYALAEPGVLSLGYLDDALLPLAISALDVACVITADTAFGRYSYPAKLCEAMACGVPVVATASEPVRWMLGNDTRFLAPIGNASAIAERALMMLDRPARITYPDIACWEASAKVFESAMSSWQGRLS